MSDATQTITVLGTSLTLKAGADSDRILAAAEEIEKRYMDYVQKARGGSSDKLRAFMILGLADDLLQLKKQQTETENRLAALLSYIEESNTCANPLESS